MGEDDERQLVPGRGGADPYLQIVAAIGSRHRDRVYRDDRGGGRQSGHGQSFELASARWAGILSNAEPCSALTIRDRFPFYNSRGGGRWPPMASRRAPASGLMFDATRRRC